MIAVLPKCTEEHGNNRITEKGRPSGRPFFIIVMPDNLKKSVPEAMGAKERPLFEADLHRQKEENEILEKHLSCVTLLLKTE